MRRVLLLDDEPAVLDVLANYLAIADISIVTCRELEAAEALLEHQRFDVVVTDLRISEYGGLEGIRLIRHLTAHFPRTKVIALSGYVTEDVREKGLQLGAIAVLEKPSSLSQVLQYILACSDIDEETPPHTQSVEQNIEQNIENVELLDDILTFGHLRSVFQPILQLQNPLQNQQNTKYTSHGIEALIRDPSHSPLRNPEILFAYASRKEKLFDIDILCLRTAIHYQKLLPNNTAKLFVNVQPRSLTNPQFADLSVEIVAQSQLQPSQIVFELTEQQTIINPKAMKETLGALRKAGFLCALDDYGMGFANLRQFYELKPDYLKMSGYFCQNIEHDADKRKIVAAATRLCRDFATPMILENIETAEELRIVTELGVPFGQGYYFARPTPWEDMEKNEKLVFAISPTIIAGTADEAVGGVVGSNDQPESVSSSHGDPQNA